MMEGLKEVAKEYRNFVVLVFLFLLCFVGAYHASHDGDTELLNFSIDAMKQILAAVLALLVSQRVVGSRSSDKEATKE